MTGAATPAAEVPTPPAADEKQPETPITPLESLKIADRCDRCGAQAFVRAQFMEGELMFCGHDFAQNEDKIRETALQVRDDREQINAKPSESANAD